MQFSLSVFDPESCETIVHNSLQRNELSTCLGLTNIKSEEPVLHALFQNFKTNIAEQVVSNQPKKEIITRNSEKASVVNNSNVTLETLKSKKSSAISWSHQILILFSYMSRC